MNRPLSKFCVSVVSYGLCMSGFHTDSKEEACLTIHSNRETSLWRRSYSLPIFTYNYTWTHVVCLTLSVCVCVSSIDCYEKALQLGPSVRLSEAQSSGVLLTLRTHFGSVWNELGTHYMVTASSLDYAKGKATTFPLFMSTSRKR